VLEGARPVRELQVAALVDEPVGIGAYMDLDALHAIMREEGALSGAWLAVDPREAAALNRELKRLPAISGIAFRDAVFASFGEILDRSMRTVTLVNVAFACVIAFGIVYNSARIALSERGNELASLRVLGFTQREVAWLLLGEQALLAIAALPLGLALGTFVAWLLSRRLDTELYRIPLVLESATFAFAVAVTLAAVTVSGMLVAHRLSSLDLVAVLKTRE
jgi:putative ABC transport system permease protein